MALAISAMTSSNTHQSVCKPKLFAVAGLAAMLASKHRSHPYYWASFIVSGDWTPLK